MATSTTLENKKKIARDYFSLFASGTTTKAENLLDEKFKLHFPGVPQPMNKKESIDLMNTYLRAFPDMKFTVENVFGEGDLITIQVKGTGTHKAEFRGVPPTNKPFTSTGVSVLRIVNDRIVEEWTQFDALGMLIQIGALPQMATSHNK